MIWDKHPSYLSSQKQEDLKRKNASPVKLLGTETTSQSSFLLLRRFASIWLLLQSGEHVETAKERNVRYNKEDKITVETIEEIDELLATNDVNLVNENNYEDDIQEVSPMSEQSSRAKPCKSKRRQVVEKDNTSNSSLMNSVEKVANAIMEGNKILERAYPSGYSGEEIYKELEPTDLEPRVMWKAVNYLADNPTKAKVLFSCLPSIWMGVLMDMIGASD